MTDPLLKDILRYHQPLNDAEYNHQVMARIVAASRKRQLIMWLFTLLGVFTSVAYFWTVLSPATWQAMQQPLNGMLLFSIGLLVVWLWTDGLASD